MPQYNLSANQFSQNNNLETADSFFEQRRPYSINTVQTGHRVHDNDTFLTRVQREIIQEERYFLSIPIFWHIVMMTVGMGTGFILVMAQRFDMLPF